MAKNDGVMTVIQIFYHDGISGTADLPEQICGFENAVGNGEIHC
ncbi:MAG: hypothetical protein UEJ45_05305 [Peptococcaceae bacterium]|nr:hypothetical protein [Peptococcaceae bacterium]